MKNLKTLSVLLLLVSSGLAFATEVGQDQSVTSAHVADYLTNSKRVKLALQQNVKRLERKLIKRRNEKTASDEAVRNTCTDELIKARNEANLKYYNMPEFKACNSALIRQSIAGSKLSETDSQLQHAQMVVYSHAMSDTLFSLK